MSKKIKNLIIIICLLTASLVFVHSVLAQADTGLEYGDETGLGAEDPRLILTRIIRIILGFLGIIAVALMMYAGWLWMTAEGNAEKVDKAKKVLIGALIGLVIIISSFAIASYVLSKLIDVTGSEGVSIPGGGGPGGGGPGGAASFYVSSTAPADGSINIIRNAKPRFYFNSSVDQATVDETTFIVKENGTAVAGSYNVSGRKIEFVPSAACPNNLCGATSCFSENTEITITVANGSGGILSLANGLELSCGMGSSCSITFTTGDTVDCADPDINLYFDNGQVCATPDNIINVSSQDDSAVAFVDFYADGAMIDDPNNPAVNYNSVNPFNALVVWDGSGYAPGSSITLEVTAYDLDDHSASDSETATLRAAHCCNGSQDEDEAGVDCGGQACAGCAGQACSTDIAAPAASCSNDLCASNFCTTTGSDTTSCQAVGYEVGVDSCCLCQDSPVIHWLSPVDEFDIANGAPGNFITIGGRNFGSSPGTVYFWDGSDYTIAASFPDSVNASCDSNWQDKQIIVVVPAGAVDGPIKVLASNGYYDTTNNNLGPWLNDFDVNDQAWPGLCLVNPTSGYNMDSFNLAGISFTGITQEVLFGNEIANVTANNIIGWTDTSVNAAVPNLAAGKTSVFVKVDGNSSNSLSFKALYDISNNPQINYIEPGQGPAGQYITIYGSNFKAYQADTSIVQFYLEADPENLIYADINFPEACQGKWWHDSSITVKVPSVAVDNYKIIITNKDSRTSEPADFNITSGSPGPGLCLLDPHNGPVGQAVSAYGENFGNSQGSGSAVFYDSINSQVRSWADQQVDTNAPSGAQTGPFKITSDSGNVSNSLPFTVGSCSADEECGLGEECCGAGTYWDGVCRQAGGCSEGAFFACAFGWTFSTAVGTFEPETCSGYSTSQACISADMCPNSPGQCQTRSNAAVGDCSNAFCNSAYSQCAGQCVYDSSLNQCKLSGSSCDKADISLIPGYTAQCGEVSGQGVWQIDPGGASCPAGTFLDINSWCTVGIPGSPQTCQLCSNGFVCANDECIINKNICPRNSTCQSDECILDNAICECCCRAGYGAQDCCAGLTCEPGDCGPGAPGYGLCTGCRVELDADTGTITSEEQQASNQACSCYGKDNRYCDLGDPTYPNGVCRDRLPCDGDITSSGCQADNYSCGQDEYCDPVDCYCRTGDPCDSDLLAADCQADDNMCAGEEYIEYCDSTAGCSCRPKYCNGTPDEYPPTCTPNNSLCDTLAEYCDSASCTCKPFSGGEGDDCYDPATAASCSADSPACAQGLYCDPNTCKCKAGEPPGKSCYEGTNDTCTLTCDSGYICLGESGCLDGSCSEGDETCLCCCNPSDDQCGTINPSYPNLVCQADKAPCTTESRGLCCGCSEDSNCGSPDNIGCGFDTCCRARPGIGEVLPIEGATNICRNALITATFDQKMDISSFTGNIIVVGDYEYAQCPSGTQYLTLSDKIPRKTSLFARTYYRIFKVIRRFLKPLLGDNALAVVAQDHNYCAINGAASGVQNADETTALTFAPSGLLDPGITYYVIIKGDENLNSSTGVLSYYDIGFKGPNSETFNGITYANSKIWSFTTLSEQGLNNGVCEIGQVEVEPESYLFNTTINDLNEDDSDATAGTFDTANDGDKVFLARAISLDDQVLAPVSGYAWDWSWSVDNSSVADLVSAANLDNNKQLIRAQDGITDDKTYVKAKATITEDSYLTPSTVGEEKTSSAEIWVFICENPWPAVGASGTWQPWQDSTNNCTIVEAGCFDTNYELYYCRDAGGVGTADDLPAILSDKAIIRGSSAIQDILKEAYFLHEDIPSVTDLTLSAEDQLTGNKVYVYWNWNTVPDASISGYKLYYNTSSGNYSNYLDVGNVTSYILDSLTNNVTYYLAVTAYYENEAESGYSNEVVVMPTDATAPAVPAGLTAVAGDSQVELSWTANTDDTIGYKVYYGTTAGVYGDASDLVDATQAIITGLTNGVTYYFAVTALDIYENESGYATEKNATPIAP